MLARHLLPKIKGACEIAETQTGCDRAIGFSGSVQGQVGVGRETDGMGGSWWAPTPVKLEPG